MRNEETNKRIRKNRMVTALFDVYDAAYFYNKEDLVLKKPSLWDRIFHKKKPVWVNTKLEKAVEEAEHCQVDSLNIDIQDIEHFCDFVKVCEKVLFYHNDTTKDFVVDSSVEDEKKRLVIHKNDTSIRFETSHQRIIGNQIYHVVDITVVRDYGKQMKNTFVVIDRETKFNDDSDLYLINSINLILADTINNMYLSVIYYIRDKRISEGDF